MRGLSYFLAAAALFCVSCTTWFIRYDDTAGTHYRMKWLGCAGRCDPAFQALIQKEDTQIALDKLGRALETLPSYEKAIEGEIHWDRAILFGARGEWHAALFELDQAVAVDPAEMYTQERNILRTKLGITEPPRKKDADSLSDVDDAEVAEKCKCAGEREDPPDEAILATLIEPGKGIGPVMLGVSTPEHVIRVYGCDCRLTKRRRDNQVTSIDYSFVDAKGGVGTASHRPDRAPNASRPAIFVFHDGLLSRIALNIYQKNLATSGGLRVRAPKAEVTRILGEPYRIESTRMYEKYKYRDVGIDVWIAHANDTVGAIHIFK